MKPEELGSIRAGATAQNFKPYLDAEIESMQRAIVNSVTAAINNGSFTSDMAMMKWLEFISYKKLGQKFDQKIEVGKSVGAHTGSKLDFDTKSV